MLQGENKTFEITIENGNGSARDLDDFSQILVYVYLRTGDVVQKYSKTSKSDYEDLREIDASNGILEVDLNPNDTIDVGPGELKAEVWTKETAANFDDSEMKLADTDIELDDLEKGQKDGSNL